jgi:hypothetical protein
MKRVLEPEFAARAFISGLYHIALIRQGQLGLRIVASP